MLRSQASGRGEDKAIAITCPWWPDVPVDELQIPERDQFLLWLGLRPSLFGKSLAGVPWEQLSVCTPGKVAAAYLTVGEGRWGNGH